MNVWVRRTNVDVIVLNIVWLYLANCGSKKNVNQVSEDRGISVFLWIILLRDKVEPKKRVLILTFGFCPDMDQF